jgi:hypothetical protein
MNKFLAAVSAAGLCALAAPAFAQTVDASVGYTSVDADDVSLSAITGRVSWTSANVFGVEAEASFGVDDDRVVVAGPPAVNVDVRLKHAAAVYGTAGIPFSENGRVYARVGYGTQKIEGSAGATTVGGTDQSWNYGVGAQVLFDGRNGVRADYTKHDFNDGGDADAWSVSYVRRF